jgi:cytochrome c oxidase cbb3-type subunit III
VSEPNRNANGAPGEVAELPRADGAPRDGIGEDDHKIPLWFNVAFLGTIVFAIGYVAYYHAYLGWSARAQYAAEIDAAQQQAAAVAASRPTTNPFRGDPAALADGRQTFTTICAACHKPDGSGLVGPSLVDPYWKYGSSDQERFETISKGRPLGMPAWESQLGADKIWKVIAYVDTLPKSDRPGLGAPTAAPGGAPDGAGK